MCINIHFFAVDEFQAKKEVELQQSRLHDVQEMLRQENSNLQSKIVSDGI